MGGRSRPIPLSRPLRRLPLGLGLGLSAALSLPLLGCQAPRPAGTLIVGSKSQIDSVDPAQASRSGQIQLLSAIGDPLYAIRADGSLEPRLATALPILSADGMRARIPLRRGVRFHDGTAFDAAAMAFSLERFKAIGTLGYELAQRVDRVRVLAPDAIELELHRPFSPLARLLSAAFLTPVSPTAYRAFRDKPLNERFVGTGPYRLSFYSPQLQRLTPFASYWGAKPANRGLNLVTLSNSTALLGALRSGEVDVLLSSGLEIDHQQALHRQARAGRLREGSGPAYEIALLSLLSDQPPLNNPLLRQAVARSLDRVTIQRRVSLGLHPALRQLVPPSLPGSLPDAWPTYDPAAARALYRRAGYCRGRRLSLPLTFRSDIPTDRIFALTWQSQLRRDLGDCVQLEATGMESTTAYSQLAKGAITMLVDDWIGVYPDAENFLTPLLGCDQARGQRCLKGNSVLGGSFWTAPGLDQQLQRSSELHGPARVGLIQTIQRRAAAGTPYLPVWLSAAVAWARPGLSTPEFDGSGRVRLHQLHQLP